MTIDAVQARIALRASEAPAKLASDRERLRMAYPDVAVFFDDLRAHFGREAWGRVTDNGRTVVEWGKKT